MINDKPWAELLKEISRKREIKAEVIFAHAWGDLHNESIRFVFGLKKRLHVKYILLNGANEYEIGCPGFNYWKEKLVLLGVREKEIVAMNPAMNTQEEAREFVQFLKNKKLTRAIVYSVPQHILRAFLTDLGVMDAIKFKGEIYPAALKGINFDEVIQINPLANKQEKTTRLGRFAEEIERINDYRKKYLEGDKNFTIASVQRGLEYLRNLN